MYQIRDPVTFRSQQLDLREYEILLAIEPDRSLGQVFDALVTSGRMGGEDEQEFFEFVTALHAAGLLNLPVSDHAALYRRHRLRRFARLRQTALGGFLFWQIPLWNPDVFLSRTAFVARALYSRVMLVIWAALLTIATVVAAGRWSELIVPPDDLLGFENLPLLWAALVGLKVFHEFGHAYGCKRFGGHVPEMGVTLILFTPCAYVDASGSWSFPFKWQRLVVCLGGVYVESYLAAIAVLVWAATDPGPLHALAYKVVFLASVTTLLFNLNPLMRYDGYYVASDFLEIPNLRARAARCVASHAKRLLLGIRDENIESGRRLNAILCAYGAASTIYRATLLFSIAALIARRVPMVGFALGATYVIKSLVSGGTRIARYVTSSREAMPVRLRAATVCSALLVVGPLLLLSIPLPSRVTAPAWIGAEHECIVRADTPGFVTAIRATAGEAVLSGQTLIELRNDEVDETANEAQSRWLAAEQRALALLAREPSRAKQEQSRATAAATEAEQADARRAALHVAAPIGGRLASCLTPNDDGRFMQTGEQIGVVLSGAPRVRVMLTAQEFAACRIRQGERAEFRADSDAGRAYPARVIRIQPTASRKIQPDSPFAEHGGPVALNPHTGQTAQPYIELELELVDAAELPYQATGRVRLIARPTSFATLAYRGALRIWNTTEN